MLRLIAYPLIGLRAPNAITSFLPHLFKRKTLLLRLAMLVMSFGLMGGVVGQATLVSDSADYQPGSTATLTGTGFQAGEQVKLQVLHADGTPANGTDHDPWYVTANGSGGFVTTWHVCEDDCRGSSLKATADGQISFLHADVYFTDATISITSNTLWSSIVTGSGPGGQPNSTDVISIKNGAILTVNVTNGSCSAIRVADNNPSAGNGTLVFSASTSKITVSGTVTVGAVQGGSNYIGTINMGSGGTLICQGFAKLGTNTQILLSGTGTIELTSNNSLLSDFGTYNNLIISGGTTTTRNTALTTLTGDLLANGTISLGHDIKVVGNWTIGSSGSQLNNTKAVFFNGTGTQTVTKTGGGTIFFDYLIQDKVSGTIILSSSPATDIIINSTAGDVLQLINAGQLDLNGRSLTLNNTNGGILTNAANRTITSSVTGGQLNINGNKGVSGTGTLTIDPNVTIKVTNAAMFFGTAGKTTIKGTLELASNGNVAAGTAPFYFAGSTLKYNTGVNRTAGDEWYSNTFGDVTGVPWHVEIAGGELNFGSNNTARELRGNMTLGGVGRNLYLPTVAGGDLKIKGNWINNGGTFFYNGRAIFFNGTGTQTISKTVGEIFGLTFLTKSSGSVDLSNDLRVDKLVFELGNTANINTGANTLFVFGNAATDVARPGGGYVNGNLRRSIASGNNTFLFPVGTSAGYTPLTIQMNGANGSGNLLVNSNNGDQGSIATATNLDESNSVNRHWNVTNNGVGFTNYGITLEFLNGDKDGGLNTLTFILGKLDGTTWTYPNVTGRTANSISANGMTSFSAFAAANAAAPPTVNTQPNNSIVCEGITAQFNSTATAPHPAPITVQWQVYVGPLLTDWTNLSNDATYSGVTTNTLSVLAASALNGKQYRAVFTNNKGSVNSDAATLTVNTAPSISVQPTNQTVTYGAASASFSVTASGTPAPTYKWQVNTGSGFVDIVPAETSTTLTIANPTVAMSGYLYHVVITNSCSSVTSSDVSLTVNPLAITITADAKSKTYGDADPALTYQITSGSLAFTDAFTGSLTRAAGETVAGSPYAITQGTVALNANYTLSYVGANLTIGLRSVIFTVNSSQTKAYGNLDPLPFTYTVGGSGLAASDAFTGTLTRVAGENVGSYAINQGGLTIINSSTSASAYSNYSVTFNTANFSITQRPVTVTADQKLKYCGQVDPALTYVSSPVVGFVLPNGLTINFTGSLTRIPGESVGTYAINQSSVNNNNYAITYVSANFTINSITIDASASSNPVPLGSSAVLKATVTPAAAGIPVQFKLDNGNGGITYYSATTNASGYATVTVPGLPVEVYLITATAGVNCASSIAYLPVYDPNGGFVTGGGWITSPVGAYPVNPSLTGKANFGFVSKYKKGSNIPDGNTEFQFHAGSFNFKSSVYDAGTLVISGAKATYRGIGTVNGTGNYGFLVTATDGQVNGGGGTDKFRIKVWDKTTNVVVYDNQMGDAENGDATTVLGGGSIVIHKGNTNGTVTRQVGPVDQIQDIPVVFNIKVLGNPTLSTFKLQLQSSNVTDKITLKVYDINGRVVELKQQLIAGQVIELGSSYKQGTYFAEVTQGNERKVLKLIKAGRD